MSLPTGSFKKPKNKHSTQNTNKKQKKKNNKFLKRKPSYNLLHLKWMDWPEKRTA